MGVKFGTWSVDEDGWIPGVVEYEGCGSHQAEWSSGKNRNLVLAAPELLSVVIDLLPHNVSTTNKNIPDELVLSLDVTMGQLLRMASVINKVTTS